MYVMYTYKWKNKVKYKIYHKVESCNANALMFEHSVQYLFIQGQNAMIICYKCKLNFFSSHILTHYQSRSM